MDYSISNKHNNTNFDTLMNIENLDEIETHYGNIFTKVDDDELIYVFHGKIFKKEDNCNLFLKYLIRVVDYYFDPDKELTIIMDLKDIDKRNLNIDFILRFVNKFKKKYEDKLLLKKLYVIHCPSSFKKIYAFIKPFLHPDTINKITVINKEKSRDVEYYYHL